MPWNRDEMAARAAIDVLTTNAKLKIILCFGMIFPIALKENRAVLKIFGKTITIIKTGAPEIQLFAVFPASVIKLQTPQRLVVPEARRH